MKLLVILCCLVADQGRRAKQLCQGVSIDGIYYRKELLLQNFDRPYLMDVNKATNELYFSYSLNENSSKTMSVRLNLDAKTFYRLRKISNGFSHGVDQSTGVIYIGALDSIYKYKPGYIPAEIVSDLGKWVSDMFFKDETLYYSTSPERKIYSYKDGNSKHLTQLDALAIDFFVLGENKELFFANDTGIYVMTDFNTTLLRNVSHKDTQGLDVDNKFNVYASLFDGVYVYNGISMSMKKILELPSAFGVAFDRDNNMIYSTINSLVRLLPMNVSECEFTHK